MINQSDVPVSALERATMMEKTLIAAATGGENDNPTYQLLRREFMSDSDLKNLLPKFVLSYRDLSTFWPFIRNEAGSYAERRKTIAEAFTPLMDHLESTTNTPSDHVMNAAMALNLAPNQYTEEPIKAILGSAMNVSVAVRRSSWFDLEAL